MDYDFFNKLRANQYPSQKIWRTWLLMAGRGFGKTLAAATYVLNWCITGEKKHVAIVGPTVFDAIKIMIEGPSGLFSVYDRVFDHIIKYCPSKRIIHWKSGTRTYILSGLFPSKIRGYQFDGVWIDEFIRFDNTRDLWMNLNFATRVGENPQIIVSTTPKNDPTLKSILSSKTTLLTRGSTYDNKENLCEEFLDYIRSEYENTIHSKSEIYGEIEENNSLWEKNDFVYATPPPLEKKKQKFVSVIEFNEPPQNYLSEEQEQIDFFRRKQKIYENKKRKQEADEKTSQYEREQINQITNMNTEISQPINESKIVNEDPETTKQNNLTQYVENKPIFHDLNHMFEKIVIGIDPSVNGCKSETGIIVVGVLNNIFYVVDDLSGLFPVDQWIKLLSVYCNENKIFNIALETNQGGSFVEYILQYNIKNIHINKYFATTSKKERANILHALYRQKKIVHLKQFSILEQQMMNFDLKNKNKQESSKPEYMYDRIDALCWAVYDVLKNKRQE